jgi:cupin superfamily acireductone dioxygenase involved in methionine salvage
MGVPAAVIHFFSVLLQPCIHLVRLLAAPAGWAPAIHAQATARETIVASMNVLEVLMAFPFRVRKLVLVLVLV